MSVIIPSQRQSLGNPSKLYAYAHTLYLHLYSRGESCHTFCFIARFRLHGITCLNNYCMLSREQYRLIAKPENNRKSGQKPFLRYCKLCFGGKKCIVWLIFLFSNIMQQIITYLGNITVKRALVLSEADIVMMVNTESTVPCG